MIAEDMLGVLKDSLRTSGNRSPERQIFTYICIQEHWQTKILGHCSNLLAAQLFINIPWLIMYDKYIWLSCMGVVWELILVTG